LQHFSGAYFKRNSDYPVSSPPAETEAAAGLFLIFEFQELLTLSLLKFCLIEFYWSLL